jgi:predicted unusual protein kinase regulating ubiquinone biosynthesis (AarF/ABC1/UbiB family)
MPRKDTPLPLGRVRRSLPLAGLTAVAAGGRIAAGLREKGGDHGAVERFHQRTAERYTDAFGRYKGALMKAGQFFSMVDSRALDAGGFWPYQKALNRLFVDAPPMDPRLVRDMLESELGAPTEELYVDFHEQPIATASIGQVHRAVLHDGRDVVVKIQYPGVAEAIRADLANAELLATFFRLAGAASGGMKADVRALARGASARISEELDYRHEAAMISRFTDLYRGHPFVRIPEVIADLSKDRVLTMTYLEGMDWGEAQNVDQVLKNTWAEAVIRFTYANQRHANLFHADPHPGNYRFNTDGTVGFLDFGCVQVLSEQQRYRYVTMIRAAIEGRKQDLRDIMEESGFLNTDPTLSSDELYQWWAQLLHEIVTSPQPATYTSGTTNRILRGMFDIRSPEHPVARMSSPTEYAFSPRVLISLNSICATLRATLPVRAIADDIDNVAEPITILGKQHHAWVGDRGLPNAFDHHDEAGLGSRFGLAGHRAMRRHGRIRQAARGGFSSNGTAHSTEAGKLHRRDDRRLDL